MNLLTKSSCRYRALACDYDGTLATDGHVDISILKALTELSETGCKLILVTGRRLKDLLSIFPNIYLFDSVVCENGAVLYQPLTKSIKLLAEPLPRKFIDRLQEKGVAPIEVGDVLAATWHPQEGIVLEIIQELGLDAQICFNKGAVMILPAGINKASGLTVALRQLGLSRHNVVGVGDAENDHAFLRMCECSVAVANALPSLKSEVDITTKADHGDGVLELVRRMLLNDLDDCEKANNRHRILLGATSAGLEVFLQPTNFGILIAGASKGGKSTICMTLLEHLTSARYQYCVIDPEGDYDRAPDSTVVSYLNCQSTTLEDVARVLENPAANVVVNLIGMPLEERPQFFAQTLALCNKMRAETGRPHWLVVDEAHQMLHPILGNHIEPVWNEKGLGLAIVTVDPWQISPAILSSLDLIVAVGKEADKTLDAFSASINHRIPERIHENLKWGDALVWARHLYEEPLKVTIAPLPSLQRRHLHKYADGDVGINRSFYFTGPDRRLNLRAQNLLLFMQIGDGVDDATWLYHFRKADYSNWIRNVINDRQMADACQKLESQANLTARDSRLKIRQLIEKSYTAPNK